MKPLGRHHSARVGFTLVELLVTVLTIGLLVSLLLTALYNQKARSRLIRCTSNLKQIGMGFSTWALDEGKSLAKRGGTNGASLGFELAQPVHWFQALSNELVSPIILVCPADTRKPAPDFGSS